RGANAERVARMSARLAHRGPDDSGLELMGPVALAARRLSIIDLDTGHQPIRRRGGRSCVTFNGEIYNYRELRRGLLERGHELSTHSDTEVVLALYEESGPRMVRELRGMFAFAIWDGPRRTLFLARDRFGQKPLFHAWSGERFVFASEIKSILAGLDRVPPMDLGSLDDYLTLRFIPSPHTMFEGIRKLPPGHTLTISAEDVAARRRPDPVRYWNLSYIPKHDIGEADAVEETRRLMSDAVRSHLVADVEVGAFLSGGMDSSLVVAMMGEAEGPEVPTFAIGVEDRDFNELGYARDVAEHCGTDHHEEVVWPDLVRLLPRMIYHMEEPSDPIAACMYHAAALASRHLKVVLTGDGGDEVFAGFDRYVGFPWVRYYAALPRALRQAVLGPAIRTLPDRAGYKTVAQKARWVHDLSFHEGGRRYAEATAFFRFGAREKADLYGPEALARLGERDPTEVIVEAFDSAVADADLDRMLQADILTRLPEHSLMLIDRMTMMHGLEARAPFLDHELAEFVARVPTSIKVRRGRLKHLLRETARPYLPESILQRPKQGFMFPIGRWMKEPLAPVLEGFAARSRLVAEGVLNGGAIQRLMTEHFADRADHHVRLWMLLNAEIWYRMHDAGWPEGGLDDLMEEVAGLSHVR
ncbi:MAG: asparagine synthase (glutamine-hydrolyzing), partial [Gemmatimonadota bacterium]|nr:asparagine synthase (glutamine-hydrolyzing) [Gemmatimonadota bacterium]